jgi:3D (Asp-Asp-Asp) domain-containing protein
MKRTAAVAAAGILMLFVSPVLAAQNPLNRVRVAVRTESEAIPYAVKYRFNADLAKGEVKKLFFGETGQILRRYSQVFVDGKLAGENLDEEVRIDAMDAIFEMGPQGFDPKAEAVDFNRASVMTLEATAYTPDAGRGKYATGITKTGRKAEYGIVAVDPKVIPLHTLVFVEGYGFAIAADIGGAIKGNRLDVCIESHREAIKWGRKDVKVHVFQESEPYSRKRR